MDFEALLIINFFRILNLLELKSVNNPVSSGK